MSVAVPVPIEEAVGRVSADTIVIYPLGSPLVTPGETIDDEIAEYIQTARKAGLNVLGRGITVSNGGTGAAVNGNNGGNGSTGGTGSNGGNGNNGNNGTMMVYCVAER